MDLVRRVEGLEARVASQAALIVERDVLIGAQLELIVQLRGELEVLRGRGEADSGNSSLPPSRDGKDRRERRAQEREARKVKAREARKDSEGGTGAAGSTGAADSAGGDDRRPGKQPGAPGATLARREPDRTVRHVPVACRRCHADLGGAAVVGEVVRQVLEIPVPRLDVTDHVAERRRCACGCATTAEFPAEATAPVAWGPRVRAIAMFLAAGQHLPYERCTEAMGTLFDAPISQGTLVTIMRDAKDRLGGFIEHLKRLLAREPVVCADETSIHVRTTSSWIHTISTTRLTFLALDPHRGIDAINTIGVLPGYTGVIMHDGLATYHREELTGAGHAQCAAHLLRALNSVAGVQVHQRWATELIGALHDARRAATQAATSGLDKVPAVTAATIRARYHQALDAATAVLPDGAPPRLRKYKGGWTPANRDAYNLATRMRRDAHEILHLLDNTRIPATNNTAERSLRMAKLHDKISGTFMSLPHAHAFCALRSYIQTGRQQAQNTLDILYQLHTTGPWLPQPG